MIDLVELVFILVSHNQILVADMFRLGLESDGDCGVWDLRRELFSGAMHFFVGKFLRLLQMTHGIGTLLVIDFFFFERSPLVIVDGTMLKKLTIFRSEILEVKNHHVMIVWNKMIR